MAESIRWQARRQTEFLVAVRNGRESRYGGSVANLVAEAEAVTLLTASGGEVNIKVTRDLGNGSWEGKVLRAASASDAPPLGSIVSFNAEQVIAGTL